MGKTRRVLVLLAVLAAIAAIVLVKHRQNSRDEDQASTATSATLPRLIGLGSTACTPCKLQTSILEELKTSCAGRLNVEIVDVGLHPSLAKRYGEEIFPSQIFLDASGKELFRHEGFFSKQEILDKWLALGADVTRPGSLSTP